MPLSFVPRSCSANQRIDENLVEQASGKVSCINLQNLVIIVASLTP